MSRNFIGGERRIVLWVPDWSVTSLAVLVPPASPAVTVQNSIVKSSTRTARIYGVRQGMRQSTAQHICKDLLVLPHDPERDNSSFEILLEIFDQMIAGVSGLWPGMAWAPLPKKFQTVKEEEKLIAALSEQITSQSGVEAYVGIGSGMVAATGAARRGIIVSSQETISFLSTLKIEELLTFLPLAMRHEYYSVLQLLRSLGIKKVNQLHDLGHKHLVTRFGRTGQQLWDLAVGGDLFVSQKKIKTATVQVRFEFDPPVEETSHALVGIRQVAQKFVAELEQKGLYTHSMEIGLENGKGAVKPRKWTFIDTSNENQVAQRVVWQIRNWSEQALQEDPLGGDVLQAIYLNAIDPTSRVETGPLWGRVTPTEKVSRSVAKVQLLLGESSVLQPKVQGGLDPRTRVTLQPWGHAKEGPSVKGQWAGKVEKSPLILFDCPPLVKLIGRGPKGGWEPIWVNQRGKLEGIPCRVAVLENRKELSAGGYRITDFTGLWAVKGYWWSTDPTEQSARCYLRVKVEEGADLLLIQKETQWYIEGIYAPLSAR